MEASQNLKRTPLYETHVSMGARMTPFAGWDMPIQYAGILREARAVRSNAGLFDVSHMGRVEISGVGAARLLNRVLSVNVPGIRVGRACYNVICDEDGGVIDDCIVYRRGESQFLLIPNASNTATVLEWLSRWATGPDEVRIDDVTSVFAMIAHQGPGAAAMLESLTVADLSRLRPFAAMETRVADVEAFVARTGYTGEDGFELIVASDGAPRVWQALADRGAEPCGLGARDVLRLEAGLLLHGNDIATTTNPFEAGLDRFVDPDKEDYIAGAALRRVREKGVVRRLVGFTMVGRGIPRHEYPITDGQRRIGVVTSGGHSPALDRGIGLGYVPTDYAAVREHILIDIRGRPVEAEVTTLPFYSRRKGA